MKIFTITWTLAVLMSVVPLNIWAKSHVYNETNQDVTVYWQAAGCAGVKPTPSCDKVTNNVMTVCKKKVLASGESSEYHFKDGTSGRKVLAIQCYRGGEASDWNYANTGNKGDKKRCAVISEKVKCKYSQAEYDALKAN